VPLPTDPSPTLSAYAHPERLVTSDWLAGNIGRPGLAIVESDEDVLLYDTGHIPGAVKVDWTTDLNDPLIRDYLDQSRMQALLRSKGINNDTTIVFYGDKNNWWATYALWVLQLFGLTNVKILDGGRLRWVDEGRPLATDKPSYPPGNITVTQARLVHYMQSTGSNPPDDYALEDFPEVEHVVGQAQDAARSTRVFDALASSVSMRITSEAATLAGSAAQPASWNIFST